MVKSMVEASTEVEPTATVGASISTWTPKRRPDPRTVPSDWAEIVNSLKAVGPTIVPTFATVTRSIALAETIVITATAAMSGINRLAEIFNLCLTSDFGRLVLQSGASAYGDDNGHVYTRYVLR